MDRKLILTSLLILFLSACQNSKDELPEGVIAKSKMIKILTEVHILEASINYENISIGIRNQYNSTHYQELFKRFEVDKVSFDTSLVYYKQNLEQFKEIYDSVFYNLDQKKKLLEEEETKLPDNK